MIMKLKSILLQFPSFKTEHPVLIDLLLLYQILVSQEDLNYANLCIYIYNPNIYNLESNNISMYFK